MESSVLLSLSASCCALQLMAQNSINKAKVTDNGHSKRHFSNSNLPVALSYFQASLIDKYIDSGHPSIVSLLTAIADGQRIDTVR